MVSGYKGKSGKEPPVRWPDSDGMASALSALGFFIIDYQNRRALTSSFWKELGYSEEDIFTRRLFTIIHPEDRERVLPLFKELEEGKRNRFEATFRLRDIHGVWHWTRQSGVVVERGEGKGIGLYAGSDTDLTALKELQLELETAQTELRLRAKEAETLRLAAAAINSSLNLEETVEHILEQVKIVVPYDTATVQLLASGELQVIGGNGFKNPDTVLSLRFPYPQEGSISTAAIRERRAYLCRDVRTEFPHFTQADPDNPIYSWLGVPLISRDEVVGLLALDKQIPDYFTARHLELASAFGEQVALALINAQNHEETRELAMKDALMDIDNRRSLEQKGDILYRSARMDQAPLSAIMLDLDHFKVVNDTHGHPVGDDVLREFAALCRRLFRRGDLIARVGGEEVLILMPGTEADAACASGERLRSRVEEYPFCQGRVALTVSIGIASEVPGTAGRLDDLIGRADAAVYESKRRGRNRVTLEDESSGKA